MGINILFTSINMKSPDWSFYLQCCLPFTSFSTVMRIIQLKYTSID